MEAAFQIINASAGSGKTFTLVRQYLKQLLSSSQPFHLESFLALTFTNKAVHEMKERLLFHLHQLTLDKPEDPSMQKYLMEDLGFSTSQLQQRAAVMLSYLLHHYSRFDVITLDGFTHRITRVFATDLKLPPQFELILDSNSFLNELVDEMIDDVGNDKDLTKVLMDFSRLKVEEGKSGHIDQDLREIAKVLIRENDLAAFQALAKCSQEELNDDLVQLQKLRKSTQKEFQQLAQNLLNYCVELQLESSDFYRGEPFKTFQKIQGGTFNKFGTTVDKQLQGEHPFLKEKNSAEKGIDILSFNSHLYDQLERLIRIWTNNRIVNQMVLTAVPTMLLKQMEDRFRQKQEREQKILLARLNSIIANVVKEQPTPYIYERLGVRYRHFFIDEFQDTSILQWFNLTPLIENSLSLQESEEGSATVFLVGDPKQAIYRWRGGHVEQYLDLLQKDTFGYTAIDQQNLPNNFRSNSTIVEFNNQLFSHLSQQLTSQAFQDIYRQTVAQQVVHNTAGYVQIDRYQKASEKADNDQQILEWTHKTLLTLQANGYAWQDVACLVRSNVQAQLLGEYLTAKGIDVYSSESLVLNKNPLAIALMSLMEWGLHPENRMAQFNFLQQLWKLNHASEITFHAFVYPLLASAQPKPFFKRLEQSWDYVFDYGYFQKASLYEALVYAAEVFLKPHQQESSLMFLLQEVHLFCQQSQASKQAYLEHWELHGAQMFIPGENSSDALRLTTFHKAKGLQFPVVLLPFLDEKINHSKDRVWYPVPENMGLKSRVSWMPLNQTLKTLGESGEALWKEHETNSQFDALNLFYVGCTRAETALFLNLPDLNGPPTENLANAINTFLNPNNSATQNENQWNWGTLANYKASYTIEADVGAVSFQLNHQWRSKLLVDPYVIQHTSDAISYGIVVHDLMREIKDMDDVPSVLESFEHSQTTIAAHHRQAIKKLIVDLVEHPRLASFFAPGQSANIYNERDILLTDGRTIRPDRLQETSNGWVLIDYKTGEQRESHRKQLQSYAQAISSMGYNLQHKILVYCSETIELVWE
ncbi:MAG: UvrD-helicase domain-containing protein [Flavobacteriaceae bacterium]